MHVQYLLSRIKLQIPCNNCNNCNKTKQGQTYLKSHQLRHFEDTIYPQEDNPQTPICISTTSHLNYLNNFFSSYKFNLFVYHIQNSFGGTYLKLAFILKFALYTTMKMIKLMDDNGLITFCIILCAEVFIQKSD